MQRPVNDTAAKNNAFGQWWKSLFRRSSQLSRENIIERLEDGWMVVDSNGDILDVNLACEKLLGITKKKARGKPVSDIIADWHIIINQAEGTRGMEMRRSIKGADNWHYYSISVTSLFGPDHQTQLGYLFSLRDITQYKLVENARQKAREELLVLLNAISNEASHAMGMDDFLLESINQLVSVFRSQAIGVFLLDQDARSEGEKMLTLNAQIGFPNDAHQRMSAIPISIPLWQQMISTKRHVLIDDPGNDPLLPPMMRDANFSCILILPLLLRLENTSEVLGCLSLATNESHGFTQDEIVRLNIISEHIAQLIDNNRRRQTSIALSERQRLLRDLHDSVSQKLYGLVTMTEASQAMLEAGSKINPYQVLGKIGENARQAVKEMRLFLHELQPVDLETEGLVSALNRRLAAVEGRADVKTRLLVDEKVNLSREEQIAFYYIAQEALNNTLRHAHAKSVSLVLKKTRSAVILEILDDGVGFDKRKLDGVGMGLRNMQERMAQIKGKLQITSRPGKGTKITVKVTKFAARWYKTRGTGMAAENRPYHQREMFSNVSRPLDSSQVEEKIDSPGS